MKKNEFNMFQMLLSTIGSVICNKINTLFPILFLLCNLMIIDQVSGLLASKREALDYPENKDYGWSSVKFRKGIYKKVGYIVTIAVAIITDYIIFFIGKEIGISVPKNTMFGLLVAVWFVLNELLSIIENSARMGANLPEFLKNILVVMKKNIEQIENKNDIQQEK